MTVAVRVRPITATPTAIVRASTTWAEFPQVWAPMLDQVWAFIRGDAPDGLYTDGHNVMLYLDDVPNVEIGVQVTRPFDPAGSVVPSELPAGLVACAVHTGPIGELGASHDAVCEWVAVNGHTLAGPHWEIYGDPDPSGHFDVELCWLLSTGND